MLTVVLIADVSNPVRKIFRKLVIAIIFEALLNYIVLTMFVVFLHIKIDGDYLRAFS